MRVTFITIIIFHLLSSSCFGQKYLNSYNYDEDSHYQQAMSLFEQSKIALCVEECKSIINYNGKHTENAQVLLALCREVQGFDRAAIHIYKKLIKANSATGAFHYGVMMEKRGNLKEAEALFQKSISFDRTLAEAHLHLSNINLIQGRRLKAMLPLYYTLLISTDKSHQEHAYSQLISLWRHSAQAIDILNKDKSSADKFNRNVDKFIASIASSDSISSLKGNEQINKLYNLTSQLFNHLLETSEENLDFYQIYYSDFFVTLVPRNFVEPYIYFISDNMHHAETLQWINENGYLFNEFRLWMEAQ